MNDQNYLNVLKESILNKNKIISLNENYIYDNTVYQKDILLIESILNESFGSDIIAKLKNSLDNNVKVAENILLKHGVDVNRIKLSSKKIALSTKNDFKQRRNAEALASDIAKGCSNIVDVELKSAAKSFQKESLGEKIITSLAILIMLISLVSLIGAISELYFGSKMFLIFNAVIVAPIFEEFAKKKAIEHNAGWIFTGIFSGFEAILYVIHMVKNGASIPTAILSRAIGIAVHFGLTAIQKFFYDKGEEDKRLGVDSNMADIGYFIAVLTHATWNGIASIQIISKMD